jgi:hypothetical protein
MVSIRRFNERYTLCGAVRETKESVFVAQSAFPHYRLLCLSLSFRSSGNRFACRNSQTSYQFCIDNRREYLKRFERRLSQFIAHGFGPCMKASFCERVMGSPAERSARREIPKMIGLALPDKLVSASEADHLLADLQVFDTCFTLFTSRVGCDPAPAAVELELPALGPAGVPVIWTSCPT